MKAWSILMALSILMAMLIFEHQLPDAGNILPVLLALALPVLLALALPVLLGGTGSVLARTGQPTQMLGGTGSASDK